MMSVETSSPLELAIFTGFLLAVSIGVWWFAGFWGRVLRESLESRALDRRFLRWQRFAFGGHYPFGHWGNPSKRASLSVFVIVVRAFVVLVLVIYFLALGHRIVSGPDSAKGSQADLSSKALVANASGNLEFLK